jgi:hypothetical protein
MGNSGSSTGPHVHIQWTDEGFISLEDVRRYIDVQGTFTSGWGVSRGATTHKGVDIANPIGTPICLKPGVTLFEVLESKCPNNGASCGRGGGFGNFVAVKVPGGREMLLAHLSPDSDFTGATSFNASSGGGKGLPSLQSSPAAEGLLVETSFKGVPRALRITPGRTILSFITDYDSWVENGGPRGRDNDTDPGVWIPRRFSNWFVKTCEYKWRDGDLRVNIEGVSQWGTTRTSVPTFTNYLEQMRESGEIKSTSDYYGYIRSIGDLHWKAEDPKDGKLKDSTEFNCPEAQAWAEAFSSGPDSTQPPAAPGSVQSVYPTAKCQYRGSKYNQSIVQGIIDASYAGGIRTKEGFAGVVGNAIHESRLDPRARGDRGPGCPEGACAWGIFQWNSRRQELIDFARAAGKSPNDFGLQMQFYVYELKNKERATVPAVNAARGVRAATIAFEVNYERAGVKNYPSRISAAQEIFNDLSCS